LLFYILWKFFGKTKTGTHIEGLLAHALWPSVHGRYCLETNAEYYKALISPVYGYYKQEHKDSKEIQNDLGDV
jgi:hypothetical protein